VLEGGNIWLKYNEAVALSSLSKPSSSYSPFYFHFHLWDARISNVLLFLCCPVCCAPPFHSYFCLQYNIEVGQLTVVGASFYNASHISELLPRYMLDICLSFLDIWMDGYLCSHPSSPSLCTYIKSIRGWMKACCVDGHSSFFSSAMDRTDVCASRRTPWYVFISLYFSISISFPVYSTNHKNNRMGRPLKICTDLIPFYVGGSEYWVIRNAFHSLFWDYRFLASHTDMKLPFFM
jgi:hypothetical protein